MTEVRTPIPNQRELEMGTPTIMLGGVLWPIPLFAIKQNRIIVPNVLEIAPLLFKALGTEDRKVALDELGKVLDETMFDRVAMIVWTALTRAHPEMTKEEFLELPCSTMELILSLVTISQQTGLSGASGGAPSAGEGAAGLTMEKTSTNNVTSQSH